jgi:curved DNA-binding protein CbpA
VAPRQGKWWNENEGRWVLTNMTEEAKLVDGVPDDDRDIIGSIEDEMDKKASFRNGKTDVKDMFYYDTLEVPATADESTIRRRYYLLAKQYHPDRNPDDKEAAEKFKEIAEAYQVLSDPALRQRYNKDGRDGLSPDKTSVADGGMPKIDPAVLFAFLFGSDKFNDYVGRLATATSASVGDPQKVSVKDARLLQKRRLVRLAKKLIEKTKPFVEAQAAGKDTKEIEGKWKAEAEELSKASYGYQLVTTIGKAYNLMGTMYQGSINSGQGLPSVSKWAERQKAALNKKGEANQNKVETLRAGIEMLKLQNDLAMKLQTAKTEEEKQAVAKELEDASVGIMLRVMWTTTVVDITSTLYEVGHMIFFDQSVDKETRLRRSEAVKTLGAIWMEVPEPKEDEKQDKDAKKIYEEAAFAAMLETVKRNDASQSTN